MMAYEKGQMCTDALSIYPSRPDILVNVIVSMSHEKNIYITTLKSSPLGIHCIMASRRP